MQQYFQAGEKVMVQGTTPTPYDGQTFIISHELGFIEAQGRFFCPVSRELFIKNNNISQCCYYLEGVDEIICGGVAKPQLFGQSALRKIYKKGDDLESIMDSLMEVTC